MLPYLDSVAHQIKDHWVYLFALLAFLTVRIFSPRQPPKLILIIALIGLSLIQIKYLSWRLGYTLVLNWKDGFFSVGLLAFELLSWLNSGLNNVLLMIATRRSEEAEHYRYWVRRGEYRPTVDILIPSYNEPANVLRRTLIGCKSLKYPRQQKQIWLLDDGDRAEISQLAEELRCGYITRPQHDHAKAGNLNYALQQIDGEIVVVFDADFVPVNTFLERTLGFFYQNSQVAMVVTPQHFYNPEPPQKNLGDRLIPGDQINFYRLVQPSRDAVNAVVCSGTSIVYRRSALEAIGGIPVDSVVEDYVTGMKLQAKGFKTIYLNEVLSVGAAANTITEYIKQRARWAEGTLATLRSKNNPLRLKGLTLRQRFAYLSGTLFWFEEILKLLSYFTPILYLLFGLQSFTIRFDSYTAQGFFSYLLIMMAMSWIRGSFLLLSLYNVIQGFHIFRVAVKVFLQPRRSINFKVTDKRLADHQTRLNFKTMGHVVILLVLTLWSIVYAMARGTALGNGVALLYLIWAQINVVLLATALVAGASTARDRGYPRVACDVPCRITKSDGSQGSGTVLNISEVGAGIRLDQSMGLQRHDTIYLEIPSIRIRVDAEVRHPAKVMGCLFLEPDFKTTWKLVNFAYCRPGNWKMPQLATEWDSIRAIIAGLYGMHPFNKRR